MLVRATLLALLLATLSARADQGWLPSVSAGGVTLVDIDPLHAVREVAMPAGLVGHVEGALIAPDGHTLLLIDNRLDQVVGIDLHNQRLPWVVPIPEGPEAARLSLDGRQLAVCAERAGKVVYVDLVEQRVVGSIRIEGPPPEDCLFSPDGRWLATTRRGEAAVHVVDLNDGRLRQRIVTAGQPSAMAFAGKQLWLAIAEANRVEVVETDGWKTLVGIAVDRRPVALATAGNGSRVYVACQTSGTVSAIDTATRRVVGTGAAGTSPAHLALSANGRRLLVSSRAPPYVLAIDTASLRPTGQVPLPRAPWGAVLVPAR